MKPKDEAQEIYLQAHSELWLHRCRICWNMRVYKPYNNGFIAATIKYPHNENCPAKGKF